VVVVTTKVTTPCWRIPCMNGCPNGDHTKNHPFRRRDAHSADRARTVEGDHTYEDSGPIV